MASEQHKYIIKKLTNQVNTIWGQGSLTTGDKVKEIKYLTSTKYLNAVWSVN